MSRSSRDVPPLEVSVLGPLDGAGNGDLTGELTRARSLLLYADHVRIDTFRSAFLLARQAIQMRTLGERAELSGVDLDEEFVISEEMLRERARVMGRPIDDSTLPALTAVRITARGVGELMASLEEAARSGRFADVDSAKWFRDGSEMAVRYWVDFKPGKRNPRAVDAIRELNVLFDAGLVTIDPGDPQELLSRPTDRLSEYAIEAMVRLLDGLHAPSASVQPLVAESAATASALERAAATAASRSALAAGLFAALPSFPSMPLDELLDLRHRLRPQMASFRAAVADLEGLLDADLATADLEAAVDELRLRTVDPELAALDATLEQEGLLPGLARSVPLTAGGMAGLAISAVMGAPEIAGLTALGAGVSSAVAQAFARRRTSENERKKHRLYVLWEAGGRG